MANPYVNKVIVNGVSRLDLTSDTVSADKLLTGYTAHNAAGASITGSYTPSGLNLNVVAYESEFPASADENTVGIISSTAVNGFTFSSTAPTTGLSEGFVWIKTGSTSLTPILLTLDNKAYLYPILAEQYISGAWEKKEAKCYQNGAWQTWDKLIYDNGTLYEPLTFTRGTVTYGGSYILTESINKNTFYTSSLIDVSSYSTLNMTVQPATAGGSTNKFNVGLFSTTTSPYGTYPDVGYTTETFGTATDTRTISYSLTQVGSYYAPGGYIYSGNGSSPWKIYKIWLAP